MPWITGAQTERPAATIQTNGEYTCARLDTRAHTKHTHSHTHTHTHTRTHTHTHTCNPVCLVCTQTHGHADIDTRDSQTDRQADRQKTYTGTVSVTHTHIQLQHKIPLTSCASFPPPPSLNLRVLKTCIRVRKCVRAREWMVETNVCMRRCA